jgi:hypothetical protein
MNVRCRRAARELFANGDGHNKWYDIEHAADSVQGGVGAERSNLWRLTRESLQAISKPPFDPANLLILKGLKEVLKPDLGIEPNTRLDDRLKHLGAVQHAFSFREDNYREPGLDKRPSP